MSCLPYEYSERLSFLHSLCKENNFTSLIYMEVLCGSVINWVSGCLLWLKDQGYLKPLWSVTQAGGLGRLFKCILLCQCAVKNTNNYAHRPRTTLPQNWSWQLSGPHWSCLQGDTEWGSIGMDWHSGLSYPIWNNKASLLEWKAMRRITPSNSSWRREQARRMNPKEISEGSCMYTT